MVNAHNVEISVFVTRGTHEFDNYAIARQQAYLNGRQHFDTDEGTKLNGFELARKLCIRIDGVHAATNNCSIKYDSPGGIVGTDAPLAQNPFAVNSRRLNSRAEPEMETAVLAEVLRTALLAHNFCNCA